MSGDLISLDCAVPIWDRFYLARPLVIVGTTEPDGGVRSRPQTHGGTGVVGEPLRIRLLVRRTPRIAMR